MDWREDPFAKVIHVLGGEGTLHLPEAAFAIQAQTLFVVPKALRHRIADRPGYPLSLTGVCLRGEASAGAELVEAAAGESRMETGTPLADRVSGWIRLLMAEERLGKAWAAQLQESLVKRILVELARAPVRTHAGKVDSAGRVRDYASELETSFWKIDDLANVARAHGLSVRRFTHLFREVTGESWLARVSRLRLAHAAHLLASTSLSVRAIAFEAGYRDLAHFYRAFKSRHGVSPGNYREQTRPIRGSG